jgi:hypothetical protein
LPAIRRRSRASGHAVSGMDPLAGALCARLVELTDRACLLCWLGVGLRSLPHPMAPSATASSDGVRAHRTRERTCTCHCVPRSRKRRCTLIPGRISHGCIRMRNRDILTLGRLLPVGTPLTVR